METVTAVKLWECTIDEQGTVWFGWVGWPFPAEEVIPCRSLTGVSLLAGRIHRMERQGSGCVDRIVVLAGCRLEGSFALLQPSKSIWESEGNGLEVFPKACAEYDKPMRLHHWGLYEKMETMSFVSQLCSQSSVSKQPYTVMWWAGDRTDPGICFTCFEILECSLCV